MAKQLGVEKEHVTQSHAQSHLGQLRLGIWIELIALFWSFTLLIGLLLNCFLASGGQTP